MANYALMSCLTEGCAGVASSAGPPNDCTLERLAFTSSADGRGRSAGLGVGGVPGAAMFSSQINSTTVMFMFASSVSGKNLDQLIVHEFVFAKQLECVKASSWNRRLENKSREHGTERIIENDHKLTRAKHHVTRPDAHNFNVRFELALPSGKPSRQDQMAELVRKRPSRSLVGGEVMQCDCAILRPYRAIVSYKHGFENR
jgi:hypothetical protein